MGVPNNRRNLEERKKIIISQLLVVHFVPNVETDSNPLWLWRENRPFGSNVLNMPVSMNECFGHIVN